MILAAAINLNPPKYGFERYMRNDSQDAALAKAAGVSVGARQNSKDKASQNELTPEQLREIEQLKEIDRKVRAHEQAHLSVGGDLVRGGASYTYQIGPDNQRYAIGGEVSIDTSPARDAEATILKAQHIQATALAPADPSPQDQRVASVGRRMEMDARGEVAQEKAAQMRGDGGEKTQFYRNVEKSATPAFGLGQKLNAFA